MNLNEIINKEGEFEKYRNLYLKEVDKFNKLFKKIFDYDTLFSHKIEGTQLRKCFYNAVGANLLCPYCNFYEVLSDAENIDHNLPKSVFPLFAVSKFNLVPSCQNCNISQKREKYRVINPLDTSYKSDEKYHFYARLKEIKSYEGVYNFSSYSIDIRTKNIIVEDSINFLNLKRLYNDLEKKRTSEFLHFLLNLMQDETELNKYKTEKGPTGKPLLNALLHVSKEDYDKKLYYKERISKFNCDLIKQFKIEL